VLEYFQRIVSNFIKDVCVSPFRTGVELLGMRIARPTFVFQLNTQSKVFLLTDKIMDRELAYG
jgi:hypothetical protein